MGDGSFFAVIPFFSFPASLASLCPTPRRDVDRDPEVRQGGRVLQGPEGPRAEGAAESNSRQIHHTELPYEVTEGTQKGGGRVQFPKGEICKERTSKIPWTNRYVI